MPNWCVTNYVIVGEKKVLDKISDVLKEHPVQKHSSENWEGNILTGLGIDPEGREVRGFVETYEYDGECLSICAYEAWAPTEFADILEENFCEDITVYWSAEEPGMNVYETNDVEGIYFSDRVCVEILLDGDLETEYFKDEESALIWVSQRTCCNTVDEIEKFNKKHDGSSTHIFYNVFKVIG